MHRKDRIEAHVETILYKKANCMIEAVRMQETAALFVVLHNQLKESPEGAYKGWMSPSGKAHIFSDTTEHAYNPHPNLPSSAKKQLKDNNYIHNVNIHLKHGFARFGKYNGEHGDEHYDDKSKTGRNAARHALRYLNPGHHSSIEISKGSWNKEAKSPEKHFQRRSDASRHIKESILNEADPLPRVEFDIDGKPVIPTRQQYSQYFQDMQAKYIQAALDNAHERWKEAKLAEKKALELEIEVGNEVLMTKNVNEATKKKTSKKQPDVSRIGKALHTAVDITSGGSPMANLIAGHLTKWLFKTK